MRQPLSIEWSGYRSRNRVAVSGLLLGLPEAFGLAMVLKPISGNF